MIENSRIDKSSSKAVANRKNGLKHIKTARHRAPAHSHDTNEATNQYLRPRMNNLRGHQVATQEIGKHNENNYKG